MVQNYIPMNILEFQFDELGNTTAILVQFNTFTGDREQINTTVRLTQEYVHSHNADLSLDNMNKDQCDLFARRRLREWLAVPQPNEPLPEGEPVV